MNGSRVSQPLPLQVVDIYIHIYMYRRLKQPIQRGIPPRFVLSRSLILYGPPNARVAELAFKDPRRMPQTPFISLHSVVVFHVGYPGASK